MASVAESVVVLWVAYMKLGDSLDSRGDFQEATALYEDGWMLLDDEDYEEDDEDYEELIGRPPSARQSSPERHYI